MEHLATAIGMDPLEFRLKNMMDSSQGVPNPLPSSIIPELMTSSNYEERKKQVEEFNAVRLSMLKRFPKINLKIFVFFFS